MSLIVYGLLIWHEEPKQPYQDYKQFLDKDKAIEAYNKIVCDFKILVKHNGLDDGDDGEVLLEYQTEKSRKWAKISRGDDE